MNDRDKDKLLRDNNQEERYIRYKDDKSIKESYQPTEDKLDDDNPPSGGSGVPEKDDD